MTSPDLLQSILYPCVRVRTPRAGGSGTIIFSGENEKHEFDTFAVTCHHVIEDAITVTDEWDPLLGKERKKEHRSRVIVEGFRYKYGSRTIGVNSCEADIAVWNKRFDLAVLKLRSIEKADHIAPVFPHEKTPEIQLLDPVYIVGCALGHPPIMTQGRITSMSDEVDSVSYWMSDAQIIFGNSGGAVFHGSRYGFPFIGVPSLVGVAGWGTPITHMGYFSDIERIYKWLADECYHFLFNPVFTQIQCEELREDKKIRELEMYKRQMPVIDRGPK